MAAKCFSISKLPDDTGHSEGVCGRRGGFRGAALGRKQGARPQGGASVTGPSGSRKGEGRRNPICRTKVVLDTVTLCAVSVCAEHELSLSILQMRTRQGATRLAEVTKPVPGPRFPRLHSEARRGVSRLVLGGPSEDEYVRLALRVLRPRHHHGPLPSRRGTTGSASGTARGCVPANADLQSPKLEFCAIFMHRKVLLLLLLCFFPNHLKIKNHF